RLRLYLRLQGLSTSLLTGAVTKVGICDRRTSDARLAVTRKKTWIAQLLFADADVSKTSPGAARNRTPARALLDGAETRAEQPAREVRGCIRAHLLTNADE